MLFIIIIVYCSSPNMYNDMATRLGYNDNNIEQMFREQTIKVRRELVIITLSLISMLIHKYYLDTSM